jgi:hypothetical protein
MTTAQFLNSDYKVFSREARAYMRKCEADPKLGLELLRKAGIITKTGKLARPYRIQKEERELVASASTRSRKHR